jgi:hypothetical protein
MLVQFAFFSSYFIFSYPSGKLVDVVGYKRAMVRGLIIMGIGALGFRSRGNRCKLQRIPGCAGSARRRNDHCSGCGKPLCDHRWAAHNCFQSLKPRSSLQFRRDVHRTLSGGHVHPQGGHAARSRTASQYV